jgi:two-component system, chemotaxis family, response regulator PixG
MTIHKVFTTDKLAQQIQACSQEQFTGRLDIEDTALHSWSLRFRGGSLIGCASSMHPIRSWCRQLSLHCPKLAIYQGSHKPVYWDYNAVAALVKQRQVSQEQLLAVVKDQITEIFFDIQQYSERLRRNSSMQLTYRQIPENTIYSTDSTIILVPAMQPWQQAMQAWKAWHSAGLGDYSPNLAPVVRQSEKLQQQISPLAYQHLMSLADGNWTLRDLALKLKQKLLPLTQSIMPLISDGLIELIEVEDFKDSYKPVIGISPQPAAVVVPSPVNRVQPQPTTPLVVYIDDSPSDSQRMSQIIAELGYRFISVQEPIKALLILLEYKPDVIFLDLVMPVTNGYEICTQIRRVSALKDTPVIILTSNDGIVDRVRAKMVGSSGFLAKPITKGKVMKITQKFMATSKPMQSQIQASKLALL